MKKNKEHEELECDCEGRVGMITRKTQAAYTRKEIRRPRRHQGWRHCKIRGHHRKSRRDMEGPEVREEDIRA